MNNVNCQQPFEQGGSAPGRGYSLGNGPHIHRHAVQPPISDGTFHSLFATMPSTTDHRILNSSSEYNGAYGTGNPSEGLQSASQYDGSYVAWSTSIDEDLSRGHVSLATIAAK